MVVVDTDVLLLAFAFHRDHRQRDNATFLRRVQNDRPATTLYNVMELLGQLSFNLSASRLDAWERWLADAYQLTVIWPAPPEAGPAAPTLREELYERPLARMRGQGMPFVDALILNLAERTPGVNTLVTWNARHFRDKSRLTVLSPVEYLNPTAP